MGVVGAGGPGRGEVHEAVVADAGLPATVIAGLQGGCQGCRGVKDGEQQ